MHLVRGFIVKQEILLWDLIHCAQCDVLHWQAVNSNIWSTIVEYDYSLCSSCINSACSAGAFTLNFCMEKILSLYYIILYSRDIQYHYIWHISVHMKVKHWDRISAVTKSSCNQLSMQIHPCMLRVRVSVHPACDCRHCLQCQHPLIRPHL